MRGYVLALLVWLCTEGVAQTYTTDTKLYGIEEGLSHRTVRGIIEDKQGFIWVATLLGLNRFDGYSFRTFGREEGLASDQTIWVFEDAYGFIWVMYLGSTDAIDLIDPHTNKIIPFAQQYGDKIPGGFRDKVGKPILTADKTLYWATKQGYITFHPQRGFRSVTMPSMLSDSNAVFELNFVSTQKTVWGTIVRPKGAALNSQIVEVDSTGRILQSSDNLVGEVFFVLSGTSVEEGDHYYTLTKGIGGQSSYMRISSDNKLSVVSPNQILPAFTAGKSSFTSYATLNNKGLVYADFAIFDGTGQQKLFDATDKQPGLYQYFLCILVDHSEKVWIGTTFGLLLMDVHENRFKRYLFTEGLGKRRACRSIVEKGNQLVINTEGGVFVGDKTAGVFQKMPNTVDKIGNDERNWYGLTRDKQGQIITASEVSLNQLGLNPTLTNEALTRIRYNAWCIYPDDRQRLWLGTYNHGLVVYDQTTRQTQLFTQYNGFDELKNGRIIGIHADRSGQTWLCTTTGFYKLDFDKGILERHWTGGKGNMYLPFDDIYHFYEDKEGLFWLATGGGGLLRWDRKNGGVQQFSQKTGLTSNTIYAVYEDDHEHLWLPSAFGIIQFDKKQGTVRRVYQVEDGITDPEFNRISHYRGADGTLYFGGLNGVTAFNPNDFYDKNEVAPVSLVVSRLQQYDGKSNQLKDITTDLLNTNEIVIHPNDVFFNLEFALLSFVQPDKVQYAYRIEGVDANWNFQNEPRIRLTRLPYGTHTLHIKGRGVNGVWGSNELAIKVRVLRPFYLQFWFLGLCLVAILLAIRFVFKWRTQDLKKNQEHLEQEVQAQTEKIRGQAEELRQLDSAKTRFFANVSHELRTPLTLMLAPLSSALKTNELSNKNFTFISLARQHTRHLLNLVNEILDLTKLESGKMTLQETPTNVYVLLRRLVATFESYTMQKQIKLVFDFDADAPQGLLLDKSKLEKIVNNLMSNALKFTPTGGSITVRVTHTPAHWQLSVSDTGRGIHPDDLPHLFNRFYQANQADMPIEGGTGIGLALAQELAQAMGGIISVKSALGQGATFTLELPKREAFGVFEETTMDTVSDEETLLLDNSSPPSVFSPSNVPKTPKPTILVVEDNTSLRAYLQTILSDKYTIVTAENGQEALKMMNDELGMMNDAPDSSFITHHSSLKTHHLSLKPDLIVSDIMMPVMDGFQLLTQLKASDTLRTIPVIMLTARAEMQDKLKALRIGVDDYMLKPFEEDELFARVKNLLANAALRQEVQQELIAEAQSTAGANLEGTTAIAAEERAIPPLSIDDLNWLADLEKTIRQQMSDYDLTADRIADDMHVSRSQLFRRIRQLTGLTFNQYLQEIRFNHARTVLEQRTVNSVKAAAAAVGAQSVRYFSEQFKERFGRLPSEYLGA